MVNLTSHCKYCKTIQHSPPIKGAIEQAACQAILFDQNDNGCVKELNYGTYAQVDYIDLIGNELILIELKDLRAQLENKNMDDILTNLTKKYNDSINIVKASINNNCVPIQYYVVIKNDTDIVLFDNFFPIRKRKIDKHFNFVVCKTDEICNKLSTLGTRLCP